MLLKLFRSLPFIRQALAMEREIGRQEGMQQRFVMGPHETCHDDGTRIMYGRRTLANGHVLREVK